MSCNGLLRFLTLVIFLSAIAGCQSNGIKGSLSKTKQSLFGPGEEGASWQYQNESHEDLLSLPSPKGQIVVSIYGFRDQTGQYKPSPSNGISTAVSQGAASILVKAVKDSGWFSPIEREGLQNLLTERKIIRAGLRNQDRDIPPLLGATLLLEGGIIGYDANIKTGGAGARYFGLGASEQYRVDQVTVSLRAVDISTGKIINTVVVNKSIYSTETTSGLYRFVKFKRLLEMEAGVTRNEPVQLALTDAIETAVIRLIVNGLQDNLWSVADPQNLSMPVLESYSDQNRTPLSQIQQRKSFKKPMPSGAIVPAAPSVVEENGAQDSKAGVETVESDEKISMTYPVKESLPVQVVPQDKKVEKPAVNKKASIANDGATKVNNKKAQDAPQKTRDLTPDIVLNDQVEMPLDFMYAVSPAIKSKGQFYAVQLISSTNADDLIEFLTETSTKREDLIFISYELAGHERFALLYGQFMEEQQAKSFLNDLPSKLRVHEPWVRKVDVEK